jgi:hypothetical protein
LIARVFFAVSSFWKGITLITPCTEILFAVSKDIICCKSSLIWDSGNCLIHHNTSPPHQFLLGAAVSNQKLYYSASTSSVFLRSSSCKSLPFPSYSEKGVKESIIVTFKAVLSKGVEEYLKHCYGHCMTAEVKYFRENVQCYKKVR